MRMSDSPGESPGAGDIRSVGRDNLEAGGHIVQAGQGAIVNITTVVQSAPVLRALHQLPSPPADFTGREKELAELRKAVLEGGVAIVGARGMGGIGKTALALKLAEELAPRYPDAQIHLDLKGASTQQPLSPAEAMAHVIRAYQPDARPPAGEAELAGLYRTILADQHALLLMDNARDKAQVEPLIPPRGNLLLVTSRKHFALPGLRALDLETLAPDDARALLLKIAPCTADEADTIARQCGYLALALRLAGSALAECDDLSPAEYIRRLGDARTRLELVNASFGLSYDLLSAKQQAWWRALAVFPDSFDRAAAAAVWAAEEETARPALREFVKYSLVQYDRAAERYVLHDLVRDCAEVCLSQEERETAQRRHATHYLSVLRAADDMYTRSHWPQLGVMAFLDSEWHNIEAGHVWAAAQAERNDDAARLVIEYAAPHRVLSGMPMLRQSNIAWLESALPSTRRLGLRNVEGVYLHRLGLAYASLSETLRVAEFYAQDSPSLREIGDLQGEYDALYDLGPGIAGLGALRRAVECYEQALTIARERGDEQAERAVLDDLKPAYACLQRA